MSLATTGRTWDDASSPAASGLARRYEAAWRARSPRDRPDPRDFLPENPAIRPGALLAVLRTDIVLRWPTPERVSAEWYRDRYAELDSQALVALIYEEFCLREDSGESPDPAEYDERFPEVSTALRRVLGIHRLVGSGAEETTLSRSPTSSSSTPFPDAGQTIAGFRLVEELGRGAFARVFLAEERQLADRPVALKVARAGSREPQTLARLQHTHIVPVHSYRTDPATGLHLLCMPFLGRVTLAQVLADPAVQVACSGAELVAALDRLDPAALAVVGSGRAVGRLELSRRPFARAVAWWAARMAEALQHAHDRGVLHRDVKPSNVLVTADGLPMLLDFNLAMDPYPEVPDVALGGTLAYMAPEHLDALADGEADKVDPRSDVYALGVVLYEAMANARPFSVPSGALTVGESFRMAAEERREGAPSLLKENPEVPPAYDAVVRRCLSPDPAGRYASAAELAVDLQAVADDGPLKYTAEPQPSRTLRWLRRNRWSLALAASASVALWIFVQRTLDSRVADAGLKAEVERLFEKGRRSIELDQPIVAADQFESAARLAEGHPKLLEQWHRAREERGQAAEQGEIRARANALLERADAWRLALLWLDERDRDPRKAVRETAAREKVKAASELQKHLEKFYVRRNEHWYQDLTQLDASRRGRLIAEVNDLLFLLVVARRQGGTGGLVDTLEDVALCQSALLFTETSGPWRALMDECSSRAVDPDDDPEAEPSSRACFLWGLLRDLQGRRGLAIAWLERATRLDPADYWSRLVLADRYKGLGRPDRAFLHEQVAVALRPQAPWSLRIRSKSSADVAPDAAHRR